MQLTFGRRLAMSRAALKLTMEGVAEAVGKTKATVSNWENDEHQPSLEDIQRLATTLCVNQNWLAFGEGSMYASAVLPGQASA